MGAADGNGGLQALLLRGLRSIRRITMAEPPTFGGSGGHSMRSSITHHGHFEGEDH